MTCQATVDMQVFLASIQRTNPVEQEIAADLDAFLATEHTSEDFVAKLREAMDTYRSIQQISGGWKFEVLGKSYEILDLEAPAEEVTSLTAATEPRPAVASRDAAATNSPSDGSNELPSVQLSLDESLRGRAQSAEQPQKCARLTSPPRKLPGLHGADVDATPDAPATMLSLRERLLSRMGAVGALTPAVPSPTSEADSPAVREHKALGGLNFKWRLLFHEGSKPVKKKPMAASPTDEDESGAILPLQDAHDAAMDVARKSSRKGA